MGQTSQRTGTHTGQHTDIVMRPADLTTRHVLLPVLAEHPGHLFWRASARVSASLQSGLPPAVDIHGYAALLALAGGAKKSQQELADSLLFSRTTMVRVAAELVAEGLVDRERKPSDRRTYVLTRTRAGAATARRWRRFVAGVEADVTAGFSDAERTQLLRLLLEQAEPNLPDDLPAELRDSTAFLITRIHLWLHREWLARLEPIDIEPRDLGTLITLDALGSISQAELAKALGVSGPTVVEIADRLEQRGLIERRRSPSDRRSYQLVLSPAGRRTHARAVDLVEAQAEISFAQLTRPELEQLMGYLRRVVTAPSG